MGEHQEQEERAKDPKTLRKTARRIADQLGEKQSTPRRQIYRLVRDLGEDQIQTFVEKAQRMKAEGGLRILNDARPRTLGGIFFHLVKREAVPSEVVARLFPRWRDQPPAQREAKKQAVRSPAPPSPPLVWTEREAIFAEITHEDTRGVMKSVKVTVIGRPGRVVVRGQCALTTMQQRAEKLPPLPKGLPLPPSGETTAYLIYMPLKQWNKVAESIESDPEDLLIIEGVQVLDQKMSAIAVYATRVLSRKQQAQARASNASPLSNE